MNRFHPQASPRPRCPNRRHRRRKPWRRPSASRPSWHPRPLRRRHSPRPPRQGWASKSASVRSGRFGSAPLLWCSAASFSCDTRSSRDCSAPVCGSCSVRCWHSRSSWPANGRGAVKGFPELLGCRRHIFQYPDGRRHHCRLCRCPRRLPALRLSGARRGVHPSRFGGTCDARGRATARANTGGPRPCRRLFDALLVASEHPDYWSLYIYLAVVTAAAFALARVRMWRWLAITAVVFSAAWTLPGVGIVSVDALGAHLFHVVTAFALAAALIVAGLFLGPDADAGRIDGVSSAALGTYLVAATLLVLASRHDPLALATFAVLVAATVAIAWRAEPAAAAVPAAALLAALVVVRWAVDIHVGHLLAPSGPVAGAVPEPPKADVGWHLVLATGFALLFGTAGYRAQGRSQRPIVPILWSASAVFAPVAVLAALYYRIANLEPSIPFAASALLLSVLYALATEQLDKRALRPGLAAAGALFATGAVAALALALTMALEKAGSRLHSR